jgi:hypothetical protein
MHINHLKMFRSQLTERLTLGSIQYLEAYHGTARMMYSPTFSLVHPSSSLPPYHLCPHPHHLPEVPFSPTNPGPGLLLTPVNPKSNIPRWASFWITSNHCLPCRLAFSTLCTFLLLQYLQIICFCIPVLHRVWPNPKHSINICTDEL